MDFDVLSDETQTQEQTVDANRTKDGFPPVSKPLYMNTGILAKFDPTVTCRDLPSEPDWDRICSNLTLDGECILASNTRVSYRGKPIQLRRLIYAWYVGSITEEDQIRAKCKRRTCVNPTHILKKTTVSYEKEVMAMWRGQEQDRKNDVGATAKSRKYGIPLQIVKRVLSGKIYKGLIWGKDVESMASIPFLKPIETMIVIEGNEVKFKCVFMLMKTYCKHV